MKKLNEAEMKMYNGGWAYASDEFLPIEDYQAGDEYQYSGSYKEHWWSGSIAYSVYWRPTQNGTPGHKYRTA